jgi:hypothetical protein
MKPAELRPIHVIARKTSARKGKKTPLRRRGGGGKKGLKAAQDNGDNRFQPSVSPVRDNPAFSGEVGFKVFWDLSKIARSDFVIRTMM